VLAQHSTCVANISAGIIADQDAEFRELNSLRRATIVQYLRQGPMNEIECFNKNGTQLLMPD
jgi:hypothetical protein